MNQKEFNAQSKEQFALRKTARMALGWTIPFGHAKKGWKNSDGTKGELLVRPFKDSGENRYNSEGVWALPRGEAPCKGTKAAQNQRATAPQAERKGPITHGPYRLRRRVGEDEAVVFANKRD